MKNEKDVKKAAKKLLDKHSWFWWMPPASAYGKAGTSDIICLKQGMFMAIETKFGSNKPTALQVGFLNSVRAEDGFAFVVNEKNVEWLEAFLGALDRSIAAQSRKEDVAPEDGAMMLNAIDALSKF